MRKDRLLPLLATILVLTGCSTTKSIPEDDQLFTGLKKISYVDMQGNSLHEANTQEEIEAALATAPNGALFGSSYYRSPFPIGLWIWNAYSQKDSKIARWLVKSFGSKPVLMSQVNPALRASVARSVLRNNGYFRGTVTYETVPQKNPHKSKIAYTVRIDSLFHYDSIAYTGFPTQMRQLIDSTQQEALISPGAAFSVSDMEAERNRLSTLFRNQGYYYYSPSYASFLADTFATNQKAQLRLQLANDLPANALHKWYIGNIEVQMRKSMREVPTDSIHRRHLTIFFNGKHSPIRPPVILKDLRLRPRQAFSYNNYQESLSKINAIGVFSSVDFQFTPRDPDTLDLRLNCIFDKPYDFYVETNFVGRTIGRFGPEMKLGVTRRNAFRGGEKLDVNLHGSYEWQSSGGADMNSYQYGADASIEFPRILLPFYNSDRVRRNKDGRPVRRHRFYTTPSTIAKVSSDVVRRPSYYKMHIVTGEWTYRWQPSAQHRHELSPLTAKYQFMNSHTAKFDSVTLSNPYLLATMGDYFIPKMRYTYTYTSPTTQRNPLRWETTIEEAGNVTSLWHVAGGHSWNEKEKTLFKNPYAQFVRLETDLTKTWTLSSTSSIVGHVNAGIIYSYGNSTEAPFSEQFYAGGANSIRAFTVRSIGPGSFTGANFLGKQFSYLLQNGDTKFVANLEYRAQLFGNLHGAVFLDAGNVWRLADLTLDDANTPNTFETKEEEEFYIWYNNWLKSMKSSPSNILNEVALGTGLGLRYDLGFLVVRVDWGVALHFPYPTGRSGYFSAQSFRDRHSLHLAVGYPF